jgi:hypothetical protein
MREQQLEDLLAAYPDDFFPGRGFRLLGRQTPMSGVGRFDVLFEDHQQRKWLIELKAVPLKITDTDQVMRYYEELRQREPGTAFIPCFVAPHIPTPVRNYLDGKGIDHREITIAEFIRVAAANGVAIDEPTAPQPTSRNESGTEGSPSRPATRVAPGSYNFVETFERLGFRDIEVRKKLKHDRLTPTVYFNRSGRRVWFTIYARDLSQFKPELWEEAPPQQKKDEAPHFRTVIPKAGLEEEAFRDLLT